MKTNLAAAPAAALAVVVTIGALAAPPAPLSLDDCVALAAKQHPALAAARAGVDAAQEAVGEARAPYYPQVDFDAGYHRWQRRAFLPSDLARAFPGGALPELIGPLDDWNAGVVSRVTLYDFGARRAGLDAARARHSAAEADAAATQADVRLNAQSAFFGLAAAQDLQSVAQKNLERAGKHEQLAELRHKAGDVPQADVLRTQAGVADARLQLIDAESRVRIAQGRLNTAIGRGADEPVTIATPASDPPPPGSDEIDNAVTRALARRPEIKSEEKRTDAARAAVEAVRASRAPTLRADGAFGWRDTEWLPDTKEWQAGVSVDLPIFDGGARSRRLARSKAELTREQAAYENRRLEIRQEVWSAVSELKRAWTAIDANETSVKASEESLRVVCERYENGEAVVTDLLDTQTALARAEAELATARWSYLAARAAFNRAVGNP
ncbi:MAG TPA: TolC family protein [Opitutus sp.]|nr:TolC family protein [Opitutus sp.]